MNYSVQLKRSAERELEKLPADILDRIVGVLVQLGSNPRPPNVKKLSGRDGYRLRIGDYRVLYLIDDAAKAIEVIAVGHRRAMYIGRIKTYDKLFYDREGDVLYITIGEPQIAVSREMDNDVLLRVQPDTGKIVGMTVLNFASRFSNLQEEQPLPVHMELHTV